MFIKTKKIKYALRIIPDKWYLELYYFFVFKKLCNFKNPKRFSEKLQWIKLYDRNPQYTVMVDKYEAKKYVAKKIGEKYIVPTLGVFDDFDDINFRELPNCFVIKCTHDSEGLIICKDKRKLNIPEARKKINASLKFNYYYISREWPYKNVKPRIIIEKYMEADNEEGLVDYKFYCFNGEPQFLYVSKGLEDHSSARISFLTLDWEFAPYERTDYKSFEQLPKKPEQFEEMIQICRVLSKKLKFLRVDLYEISNQVYFSELTFFPCGGLMKFKNPMHDEQLGKMIKIN